MSERLDETTIEAIAVRVVELLGDRATADILVTAEELGRRLGMSRSTIYERADEFGAIRIGTGPRARLRFDPAKVLERLGSEPSPPRLTTRGRSRVATRRPRPSLLPIRGEAPR
jgi:hypothetical protein